MQEITKVRFDELGNSFREIDRMVGPESRALQKAFDARRKSALRELEDTESKLDSLKIKETRRIGRNDPCPCGSDEKFKKCCGRRLSPNDPRITPSEPSDAQ